MHVKPLQRNNGGCLGWCGLKIKAGIHKFVGSNSIRIINVLLRKADNPSLVH